VIRKAVIPAAGYGTRFLPATKSVPKEMLPVLDRPVIQYVVEEAVASGIQDILIIVSRGKRAIEEHFDRHPELEERLEAKGRREELEAIRRVSSLAHIHFDWQKTMDGLGDAIRCARDHVGDEPFAVLLGDTLVESPHPLIRQLMDIHENYGGAAVALEEVPPSKVSRYGVIRGHSLGEGLYRVDDLVEKPAPDEAPSNLAVAGRYVLVPEIFAILDCLPPGRNGEIQLTDALSVLARDGGLHGLCFEGRRHDLGNKLDWLKANVAFGLASADITDDLREFLGSLLGSPADGR
jgi:UTP--glucose-1-phosphate uridylyltransferase